jgi:hypothetical protein
MNMNKESTARQLLEAIAGIHALFKNQAIAIRDLPDISETSFSVQVVRYKNGSVLEGYVDADLSNGIGINSLLDVSWSGESWRIEARLARSTTSGQETLKELPTEVVHQFDEFVTTLNRVARELLDLQTAILKESLQS